MLALELRSLALGPVQSQSFRIFGSLAVVASNAESIVAVASCKSPFSLIVLRS